MDLIGGGNYGVYETDIVCEILETNLDKIIHTLKARKDLALGYKNLGIIGL